MDIATLLPQRLADALRQAAQIEDPRERMLAIEDVAERARSNYPQLFRDESDDNDADSGQ